MTKLYTELKHRLRSMQILVWIWETLAWIAVSYPYTKPKEPKLLKGEVGTGRLSVPILLLSERGGMKCSAQGLQGLWINADFRTAMTESNLLISAVLQFLCCFYFNIAFYRLWQSHLLFGHRACNKYIHSFAHSKSFSLLLVLFFLVKYYFGENMLCWWGQREQLLFCLEQHNILSAFFFFSITHT